MNLSAHVRYYAALPGIYARQVASNLRGIYNVSDMIWLRPVNGGAIRPDHPFCTGLRPDTGGPIWPDNLVYTTSRRDHGDRSDKRRAESDEAILRRVGRFMAAMVANSAATDEHPRGRTSRMPHAVNYLHGPVHYNGGWFLFNEFAEAIEHVSDPAFRAELYRFVELEQREPLFVFRDRDYTRADFAQFVCCLRSLLPWFSNSNGPKRRVLWGNPAPYAVVNIITGNWIRDTRMLLDAHGRDVVARSPIEPGRYFQGVYRGWRRQVLWPERVLAWLTDRRIRARGEKGNLYFVDARALRNRAQTRAASVRAR